MSLVAQKHHNCPTCRCTEPLDEVSASALNGGLASCHDELLEIHRIAMCIAECDDVNKSDTYTVKCVKNMAKQITQLESLVEEQKQFMFNLAHQVNAAIGLSDHELEKLEAFGATIER